MPTGRPAQRTARQRQPEPHKSVDFTCSFPAPADNSFSWSALGHGTDEKGDAAPATNEDESGTYDILMPATKLTVVQDAPAKVHAGDSHHRHPQ